MRPRNMPAAYTPATTSPTSMNAPTHMCRNCSQLNSLNIAASGCTSVTAPSRMWKPLGSFIHAFTDTTQKVPATPAIAIGTSIVR